MSTLSANVQYRPVRIGWCVRDNNLDDYKKALRLTHTLWGGRYNPIIPIGNFVSASELVDFFKVDALFPVSDDEAVTDFISKFSYLPWPHHFDKELFIKWARKREPAFLDTFQAAICLRGDLNKENALTKISLNAISWDDSDPLSNVFDAMYGCFPEQHELDVDFDYNKLLANTLTINNVALISTEPVDSALIKSPTVNWLTTYALQGRTSIGWNTPGFYVGEANNFNDLITFWNLRACGIDLIYYDPIFKDRFSKLKEEYTKILRERPANAYEQSPSIGIWIQDQNHDTLDQKEFDGQITICRVGEAAWNGLNIKTPTWRFKRQTVLGVLSEGRNKSLAFQLPPKPTCEDTLGSHQYLVVTVKIYGDINNEEETFSTPYIPQLNNFYGQNSFEREKVRVEQDGLGFIIQHNESSLHVYAIKIKDLIAVIFKLRGMKLSLSHAGIKSFRLIKQLGDLQNCRVFKVKGIRELIEKYRPTESFKKSNAIRIIGQNDSITGKPNFDKYDQLYLEGEKTNPHKLFSFLVRNSVFRVGLDLKCPNCELTFWRVVDDLKSESICEYCGDTFEILSQLKDRDWAYRRSGIFGLEDHQAGGIPVAVTLSQLSLHNHSDKFLYSTATDIDPVDANINKCESDFIILTCDLNGKVSIVISECKTREEITNDDVINLTKVADALSGKHIDVYILFSKLSDFSDEEISRCEKAQEKYRNRVILLTDRELEGLFVYQEAQKSFQINEHATSWEDMAMNTKAIFFDKTKAT